MLIKQLVLWFIGLSAGGIIAAGVFAFLAVIGVFPRVIGKTGTKGHILLYETVIISGGILGNLLDLYEFPVPVAEKAAGLGTAERNVIQWNGINRGSRSCWRWCAAAWLFTVPFKTWERLRQLCAGCLAFSVPSFWAERWPLF